MEKANAGKKWAQWGSEMTLNAQEVFFFVADPNQSSPRDVSLGQVMFLLSPRTSSFGQCKKTCTFAFLVCCVSPGGRALLCARVVVHWPSIHCREIPVLGEEQTQVRHAQRKCGFKHIVHRLLSEGLRVNWGAANWQKRAAAFFPWILRN